MEQRLNTLLKDSFGHDLNTASEKEIYEALLTLTKEEMQGRPRIAGKKKLYYISAEFLIGKLLSNNLINIGLFDEVSSVLKKYNKDITEIEAYEPEPSLGNGGLGRLAACFLDSIASLDLPGDGIGLNYHYGLFEQKFKNNLQNEVKNPWITEKSWLTKDPEGKFEVPFRRFTVTSTLYDIDVPGYNREGVNKLHLFDLDTVDETLVGDDTIDFDKEEIEKNLTLFLYPDDSDDAGRKLRIYQQYFMVSCGAQLILKETKERGGDLHRLNEYVTIQINDTHPSMVIPELIRLIQIEGFTMDEAISIVRKTCAYTNHTILSEALEKWPMDYMEAVVPHLLPIIRELDNRVRKEVADPSTYIIDDDNRVHMAHMDIHYGYSINGVAALHTEILKNSELNNFYRLYPGKFNNKTNGITFRRWLLHCNPALAELITEKIGDGFKTNVNKLTKLLEYKDDPETLMRLGEIKKKKKEELAAFFKETQDLTIDPNSIFDVQVKRLHEYKRQQMNCLYAIYKIMEIKKGNKPKTPLTMIFGAKAAPAYIIAKDIIHLILCLQEYTANDPEIAPYFRVVMAENYNVTKAAKIIPAAEISEQISLASKEASGTSNMKFMLNGAVTLGTEDGANVEIKDLVGDDNIYIFGEKSDTVIDLYDTAGYCSKDFYEKDELIKKLVDFIVGEEMMKLGDKEHLERLYKEILNKDWFMTLLDIKDYIRVKEKMLSDYEDKTAWNKMALVNIAKAGFFSSDRTIEQYNKEVWHLK
ncbi:MAG: glycogen/starch/alpha-glucan phosphorylase [Lachnospiraceae bacterium]|nr:glycogen/starch/alpha-glucan phosphorylase [Lachnospiraceae bacterium]